MATLTRVGFGQVEPNHLSAQRNGQIYAQLPAASTINILENGQFVKYDYKTGTVSLTGDGEYMLVYNEVKTYRDRETYKDFAMIKGNYTSDTYNLSDSDSTLQGLYPTHEAINENTNLWGQDGWLRGQMVPRVFATHVGDIMTTNCIEKGNTSKDASVTTTGSTYAKDAILTVDNGYLKVNASPTAGTMQWRVIKVCTMPDGQPALKLVRIA